jgi:hypothetical protein
MREDMFKVIVERPRLVNSNGYSKDGRRFRNDEDRPTKLGMSRGYGCPKWVNENLAPLQRYLEKQVNRPWDKVYSEIRATIDARSTVKRHILQHIDDFVAIDTHWVETPKGGKVVIRGQGWPVKDRPLEGSSVELYVHPRTGILLRNRRYVSWDARKRKDRGAEQERISAVRRDIGDDLQLLRIDGSWYEVTLGKLPAPNVQVKEVDGERQEKTIHESCWDVVRKEWVSRKHGILPTAKSQPSNQDMYGDPGSYAASKRQLNSRELKEHGLGVNNFSQGRSS